MYPMEASDLTFKTTESLSLSSCPEYVLCHWHHKNTIFSFGSFIVSQPQHELSSLVCICHNYTALSGF